MGNSMEPPQKIKNRVTILPGNLSSIHLKNLETFLCKDVCTPVFIAALLIQLAKTWKQPKCPLIDDWIKKIGTHTQGNTTQP